MKLICCLALLLSGCMAVIGYYPTEEELAALRRGEDPRANEGARREGAAGQPAEPIAVSIDGAPRTGKVLRWIDSATVAIEAGGRREIVALAGRSRLADLNEEREAVSRQMDRFTFGMPVALTYPLTNAEGQAVHRDAEGRLIAAISEFASGAK